MTRQRAGLLLALLVIAILLALAIPTNDLLTSKSGTIDSQSEGSSEPAKTSAMVESAETPGTTVAAGREKEKKHADSLPGASPNTEENPEQADKENREVDLENIWEIPYELFMPAVRLRLDKALSGNLEAARQLRHIRTMCSENAPYSPWSQEQRIAAKTKIFTTLQEWNPDFKSEDESPWGVYETLEENQDIIQRWDQVCGEVAALFSPAFRNRLEKDAESGGVIARYLFSTWPPGEVAPTAMVISLEERLAWEEKARQYSALNLAAGEVAGVLAFADTLSDGLFTGNAWLLTLGFELAAVECGYRPGPDRLISRIMAAESDWLDDTEDQRVKTLASSIATLCTK